MPGPEGIGARRVDLVDSSELVETVELTLELDRGDAAELAQPQALPRPGTGLVGPRASAAAEPGATTLLAQRYRILRPLACGGTAVVVSALDLQHDGSSPRAPEVAIKLLRPAFRDRLSSIARLQREFRQTRSLVHPCIVRQYELGCDRGTWFIAMELLTGEGLGARLRRMSRPGLPVREVLRIAAACGDALAFAHDHGVTHGDVKPDNVFITGAGEVRLLDFGVAPDTVPAPEGYQATGEVARAATRAYASPEVLAGAAPEPRDDVFSLACLISEMLVGRLPEPSPGGDPQRHVRLSIEPLPGLRPAQWNALVAGMAWRREQRPAMAELMRALIVEAAPAGPRTRGARSPIDVTLPALRSSAVRAWRDARAVAAAAAVALIVAATGLGSSGVEPSEAGAAPPAPAAPPAAAVVVPETSAAGPDGLGEAAAPAAIRPPMPVANVSFDTGSMSVSPGAVAAAIPIRRDGSLLRHATVAWRVLDGSAVVGRDYGGPRSGVARFAEGMQARTLYVPILGYGQEAADRSFTVEMTEVSPGARLGPVQRVDVTIEGTG